MITETDVITWLEEDRAMDKRNEKLRRALADVEPRDEHNKALTDLMLHGLIEDHIKLDVGIDRLDALRRNIRLGSYSDVPGYKAVDL
jgi:hypothetical protein